MATGLAGWVQILVLWAILSKRRTIEFDDRFKFVFPRVIAATLLMAIVVYVCGNGLHDYFLADGIERILALATLVGGGGIVYLAVIFATKAMTWADLKSYFRKPSKTVEI